MFPCSLKFWVFSKVQYTLGWLQNEGSSINKTKYFYIVKLLNLLQYMKSPHFIDTKNCKKMACVHGFKCRTVVRIEERLFSCHSLHRLQNSVILHPMVILWHQCLGQKGYSLNLFNSNYMYCYFFCNIQVQCRVVMQF